MEMDVGYSMNLQEELRSESSESVDVGSAFSKTAMNRTSLYPSVYLKDLKIQMDVYRGVIQDVKVIFIPNGYITQCPNLNRTKCIYGGKVLAEGQRVLTKSCRECRFSSVGEGEGEEEVSKWKMISVGALNWRIPFLNPDKLLLIILSGESSK
ncbi:hypothetical protein BTVI_63184 [Pitangus sulphuratus]|nr:hypothetical protein BTVI_63184 [Pitangus sulphuratus]